MTYTLHLALAALMVPPISVRAFDDPQVNAFALLCGFVFVHPRW